MVRITRVYTRTGDKGTSALADGKRLPKTHARFQAMGAIDTLNAQLGVVLAQLPNRSASQAASQTASQTAGQTASLRRIILRIQNDLFDAGADLAQPGGATAKKSDSALRIHKSQVAQLEADIDSYNAELAPLRSFILPGGSPLAAQLHLARTLARTAERLTWALHQSKGNQLNPALLQYLNRLSDFLFVAARTANRKGKADVLWEPGKSRQT